MSDHPSDHPSGYDLSAWRGRTNSTHDVCRAERKILMDRIRELEANIEKMRDYAMRHRGHWSSMDILGILGEEKDWSRQDRELLGGES